MFAPIALPTRIQDSLRNHSLKVAECTGPGFAVHNPS